MVGVPQPKWRPVIAQHPILNPSKRTAHSVTVVGSKVCLLGGLDLGAARRADYFVLDLVQKEWRHLPFREISQVFESGVDLRAHTGTLIDSRIVYIGGFVGFGEDQISDAVFCFDIVLEEFRKVETYGNVRGSIASHTANVLPESDEIIVYGGTFTKDSFPAHPLYALNASSMTWTKLRWQGEAPTDRANHSACMLHRKLYIFGGFTEAGRVLNDMHVLDFSTQIPAFSRPHLPWTPEGRFGSAMFVFRGHIFLFGGKTEFSLRGNVIRRNDLIRFDVVKEEWQQCLTLENQVKPAPSSNHKACSLHDRVLIFGGTAHNITRYLEITFE